MNLYLVQHGAAKSESDDPARPLTEEGRRAVERLAEFLAARAVRIDRVEHSDKLRARQTAEILALRLRPAEGRVQVAGLAPNDDVEPTRARLMVESGSLMLVGHLPHLGRPDSAKDDDYSSPGQARVFQALLSQLGVEAYALVGNDTGGWIARELALIDGKRVSHLVLTNTEIPFHRPPWIPTYQVLAHLPGSGTVIGQLLKSSAFCRSSLAFGGCFHDPTRIDGDFRARFIEPLVARMDGAMRFLRRMKFARLDELKDLHRQLAMPTLFIWGANDPTFPEPRARDMVAQFPNVAGVHSIANPN